MNALKNTNRSNFNKRNKDTFTKKYSSNFKNKEKDNYLRGSDPFWSIESSHVKLAVVRHLSKLSKDPSAVSNSRVMEQEAMNLSRATHAIKEAQLLFPSMESSSFLGSVVTEATDFVIMSAELPLTRNNVYIIIKKEIATILSQVRRNPTDGLFRKK